MMCDLHAHVQSCDIISANDVYFSRVLVPAVVGSDVLPSVDVDRGGIERLDPEQQGGLLALLGEFVTCASDKPDLCGVGGVCLLFIFLVCEMVKLPCLFGTVVVLFWRLVRYCVYCCVQSYVNSHSAILCFACVCVVCVYLELCLHCCVVLRCNVPIV